MKAAGVVVSAAVIQRMALGLAVAGVAMPLARPLPVLMVKAHGAVVMLRRLVPIPCPVVRMARLSGAAMPP